MDGERREAERGGMSHPSWDHTGYWNWVSRLDARLLYQALRFDAIGYVSLRLGNACSLTGSQNPVRNDYVQLNAILLLFAMCNLICLQVWEEQKCPTFHAGRLHQLRPGINNHFMNISVIPPSLSPCRDSHCVAYPRMEHCTDEHTLPPRDYSHTMTSIFFSEDDCYHQMCSPTLPHSDGCHIIAPGGLQRGQMWPVTTPLLLGMGVISVCVFSDLSPAMTRLCWLSLLRFMWRLVEHRCCLCSISLVKFLISCQSI